ncbi:hypothetical protein GCM10011576_18150 [Micromonospora parathelypteridis]|uniref:CopC domain-containing protein n=1 Tax=Micromonospora parathelypteridis TaxID=1839617 RepID=A0A840VLG1_9ACTN|nr:hypothetical protein [Micromonospora parathelypteridis]GGO10570.1 hypothetical protein GCM10011576_18150 [Micromonospora parathelypteridis]
MTGIRKVLAAVFAGLALTLLSAAPAAAQADKLKLTVAGDGAEGVTIQATYADGRRLDKVVRLVLTATGPDGQRLGPVQLEPAPEGQGFYTTGPLLSAGSWRVKVNAPAPHQSEATATVQARAAQSPPVPAPVAVTAPDRTAGRGAGAGWWPFAAAGLVLVAAAMGVAMLFGRRRTDPQND